jgi:hypothetical protein
MPHKSQAETVTLTLIQEQRRLAESPHIEERFCTLWIVAALDEHLACSTDQDIGDLLSIVQTHFEIFEPEFALCHHARKRLFCSAGIQTNGR